MSAKTPTEIVSAEEFERLYRENYDSFLSYAVKIFRCHGSQYVSVSGRAEEAVQEMCAFAWENRDRMAASGSPLGWMYRSLYFKVQELLRDDRVWTKRMMQISEQAGGQESHDFRLKTELEDLLSPENYRLLKHLYLDGYTYAEVCREMGLKKSALAMRVKRIKEDFLGEYEGSQKKSRKKCEQPPPGGQYIVEEVHGDGT